MPPPDGRVMYAIGCRFHLLCNSPGSGQLGQEEAGSTHWAPLAAPRPETQHLGADSGSHFAPWVKAHLPALIPLTQGSHSVYSHRPLPEDPRPPCCIRPWTWVHGTPCPFMQTLSAHLMSPRPDISVMTLSPASSNQHTLKPQPNSSPPCCPLPSSRNLALLLWLTKGHVIPACIFIHPSRRPEPKYVSKLLCKGTTSPGHQKCPHQSCRGDSINVTWEEHLLCLPEVAIMIMFPPKGYTGEQSPQNRLISKTRELPWRFSGKDFTFQCRRCRFHTWSGS